MESFSTETGEKYPESKKEDILKTTETIDPDYAPAFAKKNSAQSSLNEQQLGAKEHTVKKIKSIVRNQFALDMRLKEQEIETLDDDIRETKVALDRIRACVLARYYGMSQIYENDPKTGVVTAPSWSKPTRSRRDGVGYLQSRHSHSRSYKSTRSSSLISSKNIGSSLPKPDSGKLGNLNSSSPNLKQERSCSTIGDQSSSVTITSDGMHSSLSNLTYINVKSKIPSEKLGLVNGEVRSNSTPVPNVPPVNLWQSTTFKLQGNCVADRSPNCTNTISSVNKVDHSTNRDVTTSSIRSVDKSLSSGTVAGKQPSFHCSSDNHVIASANATGTEVKVTGSQQTTFQGTTATKTVVDDKGSEQGSSALNTTCVSKANSNALQTDTFGSGSRFYVKKRVIIGNTSKYIASDKREDNDKSTHKWMVYVRGPPEDPHIDTYIQKVWFFLHPSYRPNDIVEVNKPPFHLTRRGWGEFPIRVQLHFVGSRNKRVDIIHELKLDKTYTGLQTLGAETVVDLEIDRKTFEDLGIPVPLESHDTSQERVCPINQVNTACSNIVVHPEVIKLKREFPLIDPSDKTNIFELPNSLQLKKLKSETPVSSAVSSASVSRIGSRCPSPVSVTKEDFLSEDGLEEQLHIWAEKIPLISPKKDVVNLTFGAASAHQFFGWNVGKRRAAEWQRALKIRNQIRKQFSSSKITTKDIMVWCRRNAYTPQSNLVTDTDVTYCKICGRLIDEDETAESSQHSVCPGTPCIEAKTTASTMSPALDLLSHIEARDKLLEISNKDALKEDVEIDVVGLQGSSAPRPIPQSQKASLLTTPLTPEQQWIKDVCNDIGIRLRPQIMDGVEAHTMESTLLVATVQFAKQLLRTAMTLSSKSKSSLDSKLLVPNHIYKAINSIPQCDFLSNAYLGVEGENQ